MFFDENKLFILIVFCPKPQSMKHISCSQYRGWIILWGKSQPKGSLNCLIISFLNSNTYILDVLRGKPIKLIQVVSTSFRIS